MRRVLVVLTTAVFLAAPAWPAWAQQSGEQSGSIVEQVLRGGDGSLGADAAVAAVRAYDRGYDLLQIIEGLIAGRVSDDGTITDEDGAPVDPFRAPAGVIEGDGASGAPAGAALAGIPGSSGIGGDGTSGEAIALGLLERGVQKTTKRLDKKVDLGARATRAGASDESLFTMLATLFLIAEGYSPEQIIVDGFLAGGIKLASPVDGLVIVDEKGKRIRPDGVEVSQEHEESADAIDAFAVDVVETTVGLDVRTAAGEAFKTKFTVKVEIRLGGDAPFKIVGNGRVGQPDDRKLRRFLVGNGDGKLEYSNACSISGVAGSHPYTVSGNVVFGFSGPIDNGSTRLHVGITQANLSVTGDDSLCVDIVRDTAGAFESISLPLVELRLRDGASDVGRSSFGDEPLVVKVTVNT